MLKLFLYILHFKYLEWVSIYRSINRLDKSMAGKGMGAKEPFRANMNTLINVLG